MPFPSLMSMQAPPQLAAIRRRFFLLTAYSLTSAALMGSSIGLVLYQSHQLRFLNPYRRHHPSPYNQHSVGDAPSQQQQQPCPHPYLPPQPRYPHHHPYQDTLISDTPPSSSYAPVSVLDSSLIFLQSMWFPLLLWSVSLALASYLASPRSGSLIPKYFSARTGVLVSQGMFALFWILLGCMQQVQEMVHGSLKRAAAMSMHHQDMQLDGARFQTDAPLQPPLATLPASLDMPTTIMPSIQTNPVEFLHRARIPLWIVWHLTILLLGFGTGLLTSCCQHLERDLCDAFNQAVQTHAQKEKDHLELSIDGKKASSPKEDGSLVRMEDCLDHIGQHALGRSFDSQTDKARFPDHHTQQQTTLPSPKSTSDTVVWEHNRPEGFYLHKYNDGMETDSITASVSSASPSTLTTTLLPRSALLSHTQRGFLILLLLGLLLGQVQLFQWMVVVDQQQQTETHAHHRHAFVKISSALATFGLFFGLAMMFIGARLLPRGGSIQRH